MEFANFGDGRLMPSPKVVHFLMPGTWEYIQLHGKKSKFVDEINVANQLTLKSEDYPELFRAQKIP